MATESWWRRDRTWAWFFGVLAALLLFGLAWFFLKSDL
jgi:hypothetical protein